MEASYLSDTFRANALISIFYPDRLKFFLTGASRPATTCRTKFPSPSIRLSATAVYLGQYGEITHAALLIYDYYDEGVVVDLKNNAIFRADIAYGYSDVRRPDYAGINAYGEASYSFS